MFVAFKLMFVVAGWTAFKWSPARSRVFGRFSLFGKKWRENYAELLLLLFSPSSSVITSPRSHSRPLYNLNSRNERVNVLIIAETFHLDWVRFAYFQSTCPAIRRKRKTFPALPITILARRQNKSVYDSSVSVHVNMKCSLFGAERHVALAYD